MRIRHFQCISQRTMTHPNPEQQRAFFEAFGNVYMNFTDTIRAKLEGREPSKLELDFPSVQDGARGVKFIEKVVESSQSDQKWLPFD